MLTTIEFAKSLDNKVHSLGRDRYVTVHRTAAEINTTLLQGGLQVKLSIALVPLVLALSLPAQDTNSTELLKLVIKAPVRLAVTQPVSSKTAKAGDTFELASLDAVSVDNHVVIAKGAPVTGRIVASEKKSFATRNGRLEVTVDSVQAVDGQHVPLDGHLDIGGGGVGFGRTGKDAEIEKSQVITAVVASEMRISPK
jgi:hypothetical protein